MKGEEGGLESKRAETTTRTRTRRWGTKVTEKQDKARKAIKTKEEIEGWQIQFFKKFLLFLPTSSLKLLFYSSLVIKVCSLDNHYLYATFLNAVFLSLVRRKHNARGK